jgi:hypothetical protein
MIAQMNRMPRADPRKLRMMVLPNLVARRSVPGWPVEWMWSASPFRIAHIRPECSAREMI